MWRYQQVYMKKKTIDCFYCQSYLEDYRRPMESKIQMIDWLINWLLYGTSAQKGY